MYEAPVGVPKLLSVKKLLHTPMQNIIRSEVNTREINGLRFVLAIAAFLGHFESSMAESLFLSGYVIFSIVLFAPFFSASKQFRYWTLWLDVAWYCILVWVTGPIMSVLFLFFIFAVVVASFSYGFIEGRRITYISVLLYAIIVLLHGVGETIPWDRLFLRSVFLLGIGLLISYWGGAEKYLKDYLKIMREVTRLSNPRFGANLSTINVLRKVNEHFRADICLLVSYHHDMLSYQFRRIGPNSEKMNSETLPEELKSLFLSYSRNDTVLYYQKRYGRKFSMHYVPELDEWQRTDFSRSQEIADFLEVRSFISVPVPSAKGDGRLFIAAKRGKFRYEDAALLQQIAEQAFTVLQQLELVDRLASDAAREERQRIVGDLHDSTIQPYIGLKMGLDGICRRATVDNPLYAHLQGLLAMTSHVISDLRKYVADLNSENRLVAESLYGALRRQVEKFAAYYGLQAHIDMDENLEVADRLTVEILQIIAEGLSNVHKHTNARSAAVRVAARKHALIVEIKNQGVPDTDNIFTPRSIVRRAESLGGTAEISTKENATAVRVSIPM